MNYGKIHVLDAIGNSNPIRNLNAYLEYKGLDPKRSDNGRVRQERSAKRYEDYCAAA